VIGRKRREGNYTPQKKKNNNNNNGGVSGK
jgi:hypothetical protein